MDWDSDENSARVRETVALLKKGCGCKTGCQSYRCKCKKGGNYCFGCNSFLVDCNTQHTYIQNSMPPFLHLQRYDWHPVLHPHPFLRSATVSLTRAEFSSLSQSTTYELGLGVSVQWWIYNVGGSNDDIRSVLGVAIYQKRVRISSLLPPTLIILKYNTSQKRTRASWNRMRNLRGRLMKLCSKYLENMTLSMPPLKRMKTLILSLLVMHPWT